jgi:choline dehydrogenase-like flavoprotein
VRAIENLWIADASIMPGHIRGNINAACMMVGLKLGRQLNAPADTTEDNVVITRTAGD